MTTKSKRPWYRFGIRKTERMYLGIKHMDVKRYYESKFRNVTGALYKRVDVHTGEIISVFMECDGYILSYDVNAYTNDGEFVRINY